MLYIIVRYILGPLILLFWRPIVFGRENLRIKDKGIVVSNHRSMADPVLIALLSPRIIHFMAKQEIFKSPVGKAFFKMLYAFPVNRKQADLQSLKNALEVLNQGKIFGIFPEGKRAVTHELDALERGTAFLAIRSGAPIVPVYIHPDSYRRWRPIMIVGRALDVNQIVASAKKSEMVEVVTDKITDAICALREELDEMLC
ncbi:MAG: lysophospholipid acyltransferase family protein [Clostridia bacterium]|nr:lysophospholipid acyltransferase family protein [Clostridia bacterium]